MNIINKAVILFCFLLLNLLQISCRKEEGQPLTQSETYLDIVQGEWTLDSVHYSYNAGYPVGHPGYSVSSYTSHFDTVVYISPAYSEGIDFLYFTYIENDTVNTSDNDELMAKLNILQIVNDTLIKYKISNYSYYYQYYYTFEMDMKKNMSNNYIYFILSGTRYVGMGHSTYFWRKYYLSR